MYYGYISYNAEDVRIRNLCAGEDTKYTYNTNCRLSKLLWKETNGTVTKYVYGRGLIGEETGSSFITYHFDCRGSTVALTDANGVITDTFEYDTYGGLISRTGTTPVIFGYNGRDGVVTDTNGLVYMRARYYSPDMRRFVNADIVAGAISEAVTLNRFAYANGNPVSNIDPFGLSTETKDGDDGWLSGLQNWWNDTVDTVSNWWDKTSLEVEAWLKKAGLAFLNSIEFEIGTGYGLGASAAISGVKIEAQMYSDIYTARLDDSELFMINSGSAALGATVLDPKHGSFGISSSYLHDYNDRPNDCKEHTAISNPFDVATCPSAEKSPLSVSIPIVGSLNADCSDEVVIELFGVSGHVIIGGHISISFNVTEFVREVSE